MSISLFEACQYEKSDLVKSLIDEQVRSFHHLFSCQLIIQCDVNHRDEQGRSALHYCCENTSIDCAKLLLADEAIKNNILDLKDQEGCSALHLGRSFVFFEEEDFRRENI